MTGPSTSFAASRPGEVARRVVLELADRIGPRRPCSPAEREAAESLLAVLGADGIKARMQAFRGYPTFAMPYGTVAALALAPALVPRRRQILRALPAWAAAAGLLSEGGLVRTPLSDALARARSQNVIGAIEAQERAERTVCLVAHMDTSRSGLLFHPRVQPLLQRWIGAQSVATLTLAAEPLVTRAPGGRWAIAAARAVVATGLALLAERELRGTDVPGANDNASGAATVVGLASALAARPLRSTRVVVLICGCEESGLLGAQAFLREHDVRDWIFINFDGVAAPATLRFLPAEGVGRTWPADARLLALADEIARERPELRLARADAPLGLTYDATPVLARGGRAITLVAGDRGSIPNYHRPSDTVANLDLEGLERALGVGVELLARIDRGEADVVRL